MKQWLKPSFVLLALIAILAVSLAGTAFIRKDARAASPSTCSWKVVSSPSVNYLENYFNGVSAVSATDAWAVGYTQSNYNVYRSLAEHWNGKKWSIIATPKLGVQYSPLYSVSADAANDVWAVGYVAKFRQFSSALIEHWNGTQWSVISSPSIGNGGVLYGVTALSPTNVWAVGAYYNNGNTYVLIEHWNGTQWSTVPGTSPAPGPDTLRGISAVSANDIWAVGDQYSGTLTEHWDGTQWSIVPSADVQNNANLLLSVSASATNNVWAVGYVGNYDQTLIERWDGTKWSLVPGIPPSQKNVVQLNGVLALSNSSVWMVGYTGVEEETLTGHWNGTKWSQVGSSLPGFLQAIASVPGTNQLWTVGSLSKNSPHLQTLTEIYC